MVWLGTQVICVCCKSAIYLCIQAMAMAELSFGAQLCQSGVEALFACDKSIACLRHVRIVHCLGNYSRCHAHM